MGSGLLNRSLLRPFYPARMRRALRGLDGLELRFSNSCHRLRIGAQLLREIDPERYAGSFCPCDPELR